jgi:undecaprenyl-diphosphatase
LNNVLAGLVDFIGAHPGLAVVIVFLISAGEAVFLIGLFVPSTVVLVGAGTLIGIGQLSFWPILISSSLGAIAGDALSFWIGHVYKERLRQIWPFSRYGGLIDQGERFFLRHGGKSIFIARFLPGVKSVVPVIAGMMGMGLARFAIINIVSGFAWTSAHLLPAIGLGRGVSVFGAGNPRLVALVLIVVVFGLIAWYGVKLSIIWMGPSVARAHGVAVRHVASSESRPLRFLHRLLTNERGIIVSVLWAAIGLLAAFGFGAIVINLLFEPELAAADEAISNFVQSFRNGPADSILIAITMIGDGLVLSALAVTLVGAFVAYRRWRSGIGVLLAMIGAALFVPLIKSILQRPRPTALYSGAEAFSFPSGHATLSMTVFGIIAVVLADGRPPRTRLAIYFFAAILIGTIALSRVYLGAHWPSDVVAGILFGLAMVSVVAFLLHQVRMPLPVRGTAIALGIAFVAAYGFDLTRNYGSWAIAYANTPQPTIVSETTWVQSTWQSLPQRRIQLDGETGEYLVAQTDVPAPQLVEGLGSAGWKQLPPATLLDAALVLIPSRAPLETQMPIPSLHDGRNPRITFAKLSARDPGARYILRFWTSGTEVGDTKTAAPILLGSVTLEVEEPWAFGFTTLDPTTLSANERQTVESELEATLGALPGTTISRSGEQPFLAVHN